MTMIDVPPPAADQSLAADDVLVGADPPPSPWPPPVLDAPEVAPPGVRCYLPALGGVLVATLVAYVWGLSASGWANSYYSAAAQAGASSWKAWFFGSFDAASSITVDKPPAALWIMGLSVRVFGLSSWSILVPEALMGVGAVAVLAATVRRWFGDAAALAAAVVFATTPVAVLMFRFNNPDALLVLLLVAAAYAVSRAIEAASTRWLALAGVLVGFGFLTKMLQALIVLPAFALAYLVAADTPLRRRIVQLLVAGAAMVAAGGWWVAIVELWPASSRPNIGGSQDNSVLELIFGYNGFGRLTGEETGSVGGGNGGRWGETGLLRMFSDSYGGQISWLLPAALVLLAAGLAITWRRARTDRTRAALLLWGGWLLVTGVVFSLGEGIIHEYYTVALAPAIAALVAIGGVTLVRHRQHLAARAMLAGTVLLTAWWTSVLLGRTTSWHTWLTPFVWVASIAAAAALLIADRRRSLVAAGVALALSAGLAAPIAASATTIGTAHTGSLPSAGPDMGTANGPGGRGMPGGGAGAGTGTFPGGGRPGAGQPGTGTFPGGRDGTGAVPGGGQGTGQPGAGQPGAGQQGGMGGMGSLLDATTPSDEIVAALTKDADEFTWILATTGANNAAGYQLATELPVMAIGGFNGSDDSPTLAQFQSLVADGEIHWYVGGGNFGGQNGGSGSASEIAQWVQQTFTSVTIDGTTFYDLTAPLA